jgi:acyl carrier protein
VTSEKDLIREFVIAHVNELATREDVSVGEVADDFDLMESGLFDSLRFAALVSAVEERFDLQMNFDDIDPEEFVRVGGFVAAATRVR